MDAKTKITTPNSDFIHDMTFADLSETGPLVFDAPPKLQDRLLDFWQRPILEDGGKFFGDVGLPGPDAGAGGILACDAIDSVSRRVLRIPARGHTYIVVYISVISDL